MGGGGVRVRVRVRIPVLAFVRFVSILLVLFVVLFAAFISNFFACAVFVVVFSCVKLKSVTIPAICNKTLTLY